MKYITSKENPLYKKLLNVARQKIKKEVLLEGLHLSEMWWLHKGQAKAILLQEGNLHPDIHTFLARIPNPTLICLSPSLFKALNHVDSPQGVMSWVCIPEAEQNSVQHGAEKGAEKNAYQAAKNKGGKPHHAEISPPTENAVLLDGVQDPGNVGTIIRTCAALAIRHLYLSPACANPWSAKVLRSAQGAHFVVNLYPHTSIQPLLSVNKLPLYLTHLSPQAQHIYHIDIPKHVLWVFGNEGSGVSDEVLNYPHQAVYIPQSDQIDSLNVGVASAVVLYEQKRRYG